MPISHHTLPLALAVDGADCIGQFAYEADVDSVVVFVHGLGGGAVTTWQDFNILLPEDKRAAKHDLLFFGYKSLKSPSENSALVLLNFLRRLSGGPKLTVLPRYQRDYRNITLVAHSLGAIVCRKALLMEAAATEPSNCALKLILVAPADRANASDLWKMVDGPVAVLFAGFFLKFPSLRDLRAEDLVKLRKKVEDGVGDHSYLIATRVVNAQDDQYVSPEKYVLDPHFPDEDAKMIVDADHSSVCKPQALSSDAYKSIVEGL